MGKNVVRLREQRNLFTPRQPERPVRPVELGSCGLPATAPLPPPPGFEGRNVSGAERVLPNAGATVLGCQGSQEALDAVTKANALRALFSRMASKKPGSVACRGSG